MPKEDNSYTLTSIDPKLARRVELLALKSNEAIMNSLMFDPNKLIGAMFRKMIEDAHQQFYQKYGLSEELPTAEDKGPNTFKMLNQTLRGTDT